MLDLYPILKLEQLLQTVKEGLLDFNDYYQNTDALIEHTWRQILQKSTNLLFFVHFSLREWTRTPMPFYFTLVLYTCEGALQERPPLISPIRAAAVGLLELMRTGPLISMEWRWGGGASMGLWDMVREVKECRFLLFFFSPTRWAPLLRGPEEAPSPESPLESDGLSNSISWRAAVLNCESKRKTTNRDCWRPESTEINFESVTLCNNVSLKVSIKPTWMVSHTMPCHYTKNIHLWEVWVWECTLGDPYRHLYAKKSKEKH